MGRGAVSRRAGRYGRCHRIRARGRVALVVERARGAARPGGFGPRPTAIKPILTTAKNDVSSMSWVDDVQCRVTRECDLGKDAVYASYAAFCDKSNLMPLSLVTFWTRVVQVLLGLQIRKKRINGAETRVCNIQPAPADRQETRNRCCLGPAILGVLAGHTVRTGGTP